MEAMRKININEINFSKTNRQVAEDDELKELAQSISTHGLLEPVLVRPHGRRFELVAGERRVRAALKAGLVAVSAIVREMSDAEALEVQIIENTQRKDLSPLDEAFAYQRLRDEIGYSVRDICTRTHKSDAHVYQTLSLLNLPPVAISALRDGRISKQVAVLIAQLETKQLQIEASNALSRPEWADEPMTVRAAKSLIIQMKSQAGTKRRGRTTGKGRPESAPKNGRPDYRKDWRYYLVRFDSADFIKWRTICHSRHDEATMSDAVDVVMLDKAALQRQAVSLPAAAVGRGSKNAGGGR